MTNVFSIGAVKLPTGVQSYEMATGNLRGSGDHNALFLTPISRRLSLVFTILQLFN